MSDLMSSFELTFFPIAAMLLFAGAFAGILARVLFRRARGEMEHAASIPFSDEPGLQDAGRPRSAAR